MTARCSSACRPASMSRIASMRTAVSACSRASSAICALGGLAVAPAQRAHGDARPAQPAPPAAGERRCGRAGEDREIVGHRGHSTSIRTIRTKSEQKINGFDRQRPRTRARQRPRLTDFGATAYIARHGAARHPHPARQAAAARLRTGQEDRRGDAQAGRGHVRDHVRRARHRARRHPGRRAQAHRHHGPGQEGRAEGAAGLHQSGDRVVSDEKATTRRAASRSRNSTRTSSGRRRCG